MTDLRIEHQSVLACQVWRELRRGTIRLEIARTELAWAQAAMTAGHIPAEVALDILNDTFDQLAGGAE